MDQSDQSLMVQSWEGHGSDAMHACVSRVVPLQASPLCDASVSTLRIRVCRPSPQLALQSVQACQSENWQGVGEGPPPQGRVSRVLAAQEAPPLRGSEATARVL
mmetsp:Transcript_100455/g.279752  ORF Transcript_100455/g.279752 Transcript_100455/m.279752 type:complete len:104 (-) Transcript_100455:504-815(-)